MKRIRHEDLRHNMTLRVPLSLYEWMLNNRDGVAPSTFAVQKLSELARADPGKVDASQSVAD